MQTVLTRAKVIELLKDGAVIEHNRKRRRYCVIKKFVNLGTVRQPTVEQLIARNIIHKSCELGPCIVVYKY